MEIRFDKCVAIVPKFRRLQLTNQLIADWFNVVALSLIYLSKLFNSNKHSFWIKNCVFLWFHGQYVIFYFRTDFNIYFECIEWMRSKFSYSCREKFIKYIYVRKYMRLALCCCLAVWGFQANIALIPATLFR